MVEIKKQRARVRESVCAKKGKRANVELENWEQNLGRQRDRSRESASRGTGTRGITDGSLAKIGSCSISKQGVKAIVA